MLLLKKRFDVPNASEITPERLVGQRRLILQAMAAGLAFVPPALLYAQTAGNQKLFTKPGPNFGLVSANEPSTPYKDVSTYNNFYEFGVDKDDPAKYAGSLKTKPWTVAIEGAVNKPQIIGIEELLKFIPWVGFSLSELIKKVEPTGNAKYLEFVTLSDRKQMPGLRSPVLDWPYIEGLRMDEAMNPMTLLGLGLYGEVLPNQNGAPVRLVVPWKYGFKSGKSLVKIRFVEKQPLTSWNKSGPSEYGFFSNVNPDVDHPRWSQATERRIGQDGFLQRKRKTMMFNGYADQVASLYQGMDLKKFF
jgi:methionine sulfoxide reductase catalytic subunit